MKELKVWAVFLCFAILVFLLWSSIFYFNTETRLPESGDIYVYIGNQENPFAKKNETHYKILAVSNGYVLFEYKFQEKLIDVDSQKVDYFLTGMKRTN